MKLSFFTAPLPLLCSNRKWESRALMVTCLRKDRWCIIMTEPSENTATLVRNELRLRSDQGKPRLFYLNQLIQLLTWISVPHSRGCVPVQTNPTANSFRSLRSPLTLLPVASRGSGVNSRYHYRMETKYGTNSTNCSPRNRATSSSPPACNQDPAANGQFSAHWLLSSAL